MSNNKPTETSTTAASECCISGVCDHHNAINIARAEHAKFVAAARWLRANGWTFDRTDGFGTREWRWWDKPILGTEISVFAIEGKLSRFTVVGNHFDFDFDSQDTTVAQAIDFLVVAKVLPAEFGSWNQPQPMIADGKGRIWGWQKSGYRNEHSAILSRDYLEANLGPMREVQS